MRARATSTKLDELDFLSVAALNLVEISAHEDVFGFVAEQLATIAPDSLIVTSRFEPSNDCTVVRDVAGPPEMLTAVRAALGQEMTGLPFRVNEDARRTLVEGKLVQMTDSLIDVTFDTWALDLYRKLRAPLRIRSVHAQPFARRGDYLGILAIFSRTPRLEHARLIEAFIRLAAVASLRLRAEARLRDSEGRFRMLAENSSDVIFRLQLVPERKFEYVSPAASHVVGVRPEELYEDADLGVTCLYAKEWTSAAPPREAPIEPIVVRCHRRDGTYTWTEQRVTPIRNERGELVALEGIVRDVTKRKEAEDALIEADRRKNEFLAVLSHELRNPLSPIRNALYILERTDPGTEQATRARAVIERQVTHLTRLVDDLLDLTRITRGKIRLQREPVELNELVRVTVEDHRPMFARAKIDLDVTLAKDDAWIHGDRTRIAQVVGNLLLNAAKFTPARGRTSVLVSTDPSTKQAILRVRDTGVGFAPEILPHLFQPFMQADTTIERSKGGLGLGLMLVRGFVEMHGGTVEATSAGPGQGAEITVRLPLEAAKPLKPAPGAPLANGERVRVLVIEDNVDAADTLRETLRLKHDVEVAYSGPEGIDKARAFHPDVVVCDIGLPGLDGYAVAHALREDPELHDVALVALTGFASPEDIENSSRAGFDRHLPKPPKIDMLESVVAELATARRRAQACAHT